MEKFTLTKKDEILAMAQSLPKNKKESVLISGGWDKDFAIGVVVADDVKAKAEVHEKMRDVWYVLSGSAKFILGGKLINPESPRKGEWLADEMEGGEVVEVVAGGVLNIPPGVAHQIDAIGSKLESFIVKVPI